MTAYLWLVIVGTFMVGIGSVGHLITTRIVQTDHTTTIKTRTFYVGADGLIRTEYSPDIEKFWSEHRIVKNPK